jgi:hypothetical protein
MGLRIGCDLDGTLADMDAALQREAERLFGPRVVLHARGGRVEMPSVDENKDAGDGAPADAGGTMSPSQSLSARQLRQLWTHVGQVDDFWTTLAEIERGTVARFAELAARHRWDVIFFTQRPATAGQTPQLQAQRWLRAHGFEFPSVFIVGGARGKAAAGLRLHAVLDDRPENCLDVANESKACPILVWRDGAETVPPGARRLGIDTVLSFSDALSRLEQMDVERKTPRSLTSRVRDAIGL